MNRGDISALLDYHYWARDRVLDAAAAISGDEFLAARSNSFSSIRDTLAHMYFAEWAWYSRWQGQSPTALPDPGRFQDVGGLRAAWQGLEQQVRGFVDPLDDAGLAREVEYRLLSGVEAVTPLWQMIQHIVNHASYHRGQVTTMLRQAGAQPPKSMDLIAFYRGRQLRMRP
jgi:uncharacterized damage-inducible protein DinB